MSSAAKVVIGANYGDEGKGHMVDFLAAQSASPATVIRFNSSAQAGHTVVTPGGRRHVFHHVGAGAFAGAGTLLSRFFVAHPMLLTEELAALAALDVAPQLAIDPRARVAVPYDVLLNQAIERHRGHARHGSCGIGFNEAVERSLRPAHDIRVSDLMDPATLRRRLRTVRDVWVPKRLRVLGLDSVATGIADLLQTEALIDRWLADVVGFLDQVDVLSPGTRPEGALIFEGAQGLLLDQDGADYPHVTRSKTGLANVVRLAQEMEIDDLEVTYVTRAYLTRHGAGPLANEMPEPPVGVVDETNAPNAFQGALRFAWLDPERLASQIRRDLGVRAPGIAVRANLAVTCLDQVAKTVRWHRGGDLKSGTADEFLKTVAEATSLDVAFRSFGPARDDIARAMDVRGRRGEAVDLLASVRHALG